jgi:hypothetical protein
MEYAVNAAGVALVMGIVEAFKNFGLPSKYAPLVSLALGIGFSFASAASGTTPVQAVMEGLVIGLAASGFYSGAKAVAK